MENVGQINCYEPVGFGRKPVYIINLNTGVTPFIHFFDGHEYRSMCYRLRQPVLVTVEFAHYRPMRAEFDLLDKDVQDHVLNAGLLSGKLFDVRPLTNDPVSSEWEYEQFQEWALSYYGRRLGSLGDR